ncbi:MAG: hypothetical protein M1420_00580 [Actinobacteria bacterium]|nr:hypothetical protein [Actinomycetota bacterium]
MAWLSVVAGYPPFCGEPFSGSDKTLSALAWHLGRNTLAVTGTCKPLYMTLTMPATVLVPICVE